MHGVTIKFMTTMSEFVQNLLLRRQFTGRQQAYVCLTEQ